MEKYMYIFSEDLVWISVSMICATVVYKQIAPYLWSYKKGEALIGRFQRVAKEQKEKREFQFNLNLPQKKGDTDQTDQCSRADRCIVFFCLCCAWDWYDDHFILFFSAYVMIGLLACSVVKAIPAELFAGFNWNGQLDLRLYYSWLWPINTSRAVRHRITKEKHGYCDYRYPKFPRRRSALNHSRRSN